MKIPLFLVGALAGSALVSSSPGQFIENYSATPNAAIPDGDFTGVASSIVVSGTSILEITDLTVTLNITGGFNGDFFAYLVHTTPGGSAAGFVTLLNRTGVTGSNPVGYADAGFSVTFTDSGSDIHLYQNSVIPGAGLPLTGFWAPDGRAVNPLTVTDLTPRSDSLASFIGDNAGGTWTRFVADVAGGDQGQFVNWSMQITGIPEPGTWLIGTLAVGVIARPLRYRRKA